MKDPTRYVSGRVQKVSRGRRALSRQAAVAVKKLQNDPSFRKLITEITRYLIELAIRITVVSAVNQCIRPGGEQARVVPFRPKRVS
jgi:hypothetical protein